MIRRILVCCLFLALPWAIPAHGQTFPALTGRVVDAANLLTPAEEAALTTELAALETRTRRQLVVATIPDLQGYAVEDYGYQLGRHWAIGDKERNDGALLIVAPNERKVRVEVGYGLEPVLTDALSSTIISRDIVPAFRNGNYAAGIMAGTASIIKQLELPEDEARKIAAEASKKAGDQTDIPSILFWVFFVGVFVLPTVMSFFGGGRKHRGGGRSPVVIWGPGMGGWGRGSGGGWGGGGFSGGGGSFGGGGSSGSW